MLVQKDNNLMLYSQSHHIDIAFNCSPIFRLNTACNRWEQKEREEEKTHHTHVSSIVASCFSYGKPWRICIFIDCKMKIFLAYSNETWVSDWYRRLSCRKLSIKRPWCFPPILFHSFSPFLFVSLSRRPFGGWLFSSLAELRCWIFVLIDTATNHSSP